MTRRTRSPHRLTNVLTWKIDAVRGRRPTSRRVSHPPLFHVEHVTPLVAALPDLITVPHVTPQVVVTHGHQVAPPRPPGREPPSA